MVDIFNEESATHPNDKDQGFRYPILVGGGRIWRKRANFGVFRPKSAYFATLVGGGGLM